MKWWEEKGAQVYCVTFYRGKRATVQRFATLEQARAFASRIFIRYGVIAGIERGSA